MFCHPQATRLKGWCIFCNRQIDGDDADDDDDDEEDDDDNDDNDDDGDDDGDDDAGDDEREDDDAMQFVFYTALAGL